MKLGEKIIIKVIDIIKDSESIFDDNIKTEVAKIIVEFAIKPEELDLKTISRLEVLLGQNLIFFPTKKEWRKIKLDKLNNINNDNN